MPRNFSTAWGEIRTAPDVTVLNPHDFEGDWISDGNYGEKHYLPAGTPIKVYGLSGNVAYAEIGGRLGHDYGRKQESLQHGDQLLAF